MRKKNVAAATHRPGERDFCCHVTGVAKAGVNKLEPMLHVDTYIGPSRLHGRGIFASKFLPSGTLIWSFDPVNDSCLSEPCVRVLASILGDDCVARLLHFAYFDAQLRAYVLHTDGLQFMNHSGSPNTRTSSDGRVMYATCDIHAFEELTEDYEASYGARADCAAFLRPQLKNFPQAVDKAHEQQPHEQRHDLPRQIPFSRAG
jgi:hypothetical protein